jgi:hypothetical protein
MNPVAASRLKMMLAAGKHRLENKAARSKEERRCRRAEKVLERYRKEHGPLTYESPPAILDLARVVAHHRAMLNDPKYRAFTYAQVLPPDPAPAPKAEKPKRNRAYFEELRTRQAEARAADPEKFEAERRAARIASNRYWDHIRFERAHSNAAAEIAEVLPKDRAERYREIWQVITQSILAHRWLIQNAGQVQLYYLRKKQPRVRGVGRAARLAGF